MQWSRWTLQPSTREPLRPLQRSLYAWVAFATGAPHFVLLLYFLKFGTDVVRLDPAVVGAVFGVSRLWDAVTDVFIGRASDRRSTRWGRRRPWLAVGGVGLALSVAAIWAVPRFQHETLRAAWLFGAVLLYFTAHTMVVVPHAALGVELTRGFADRNALYAYRHVAFTLAMVAGVGAVAAFSESPRPYEVGWAIAVGGALLVLLGVAPFVSLLREDGSARTSPIALGRALGRLVRERPALRLLAISFVQRLGSAALSALGPFVTALLIGDESALGPLLGAYIAVMLLVGPLVPPAARRFGTVRMWRASMLLGVVGFSLLALVERGQLGLLIACAVVVGIADAVSSVTDRSLFAAAIDASERSHGVRDEALFLGAHTFVEKSAYGVAVMVAGAALSAAGYEPSPDAQPAVAATLRALIAGLPAAGLFAGLLLSFGVRLGENADDR